MALTVALTNPPGAATNPQSVGQHKVVTKDIKVTSDAANDTGAITMQASTLGLRHIFGAVMVAANPLDDDDDTVGYAVFDVAAGGASVVITPKTAAAAAIDLDAADNYTIRVAFTGD